MSKNKEKRETSQNNVIPAEAGQTAPVRAKQKKKMSVKGLLLRCVLLAVAPYAYLMLCGLVLDMWLKIYDAVPFIFYSLITFYAVDLVLIIYFIIKFVMQRRKTK